MPRHDASELATRLGREAEAVCRHYLSSGHRAGRYWLVGDVQNTPGRSMFVRLTGRFFHQADQGLAQLGPAAAKDKPKASRATIAAMQHSVGKLGGWAHNVDYRTLPDSAHCFLIRHGNDSVVARLDLSGERELLTILSGREATVRLFDDLRRTTGDDPRKWMPQLLKGAA